MTVVYWIQNALKIVNFLRGCQLRFPQLFAIFFPTLFNGWFFWISINKNKFIKKLTVQSKNLKIWFFSNFQTIFVKRWQNKLTSLRFFIIIPSIFSLISLFVDQKSFNNLSDKFHEQNFHSQLFASCPISISQYSPSSINRKWIRKAFLKNVEFLSWGFFLSQFSFFYVQTVFLFVEEITNWEFSFYQPFFCNASTEKDMWQKRERKYVDRDRMNAFEAAKDKHDDDHDIT